MATDPNDAVQFVFRWSDAFAILGAAAWIPQLIRLMRGPKVTVVPGSPVEVGFTGFGPIFNPTLAFRTQHRDSLVVGIGCDLVHQHGQKFVMTAAQLSESAGFTQSADQTVVHGRQQSAIAIVLSPTAVAERKAASHQVAHRKSLDQLMVAYGEAVVRVQPGPAEAWFQRVQATPEYAAARNSCARPSGGRPVRTR